MRKYSDYSVNDLQEMLVQHVNNKQFYRTEQYCFTNGCTIKENWTGKNRRRIDFKNVVFEGAQLNQAGFAGSTFSECFFKSSTEMMGVNFSGCNFINCTFDSVECFAIFSKSKFTHTIFKNCKLNDCNFEDAYFNDTDFNNCHITSANWENSNLYAANFNSCKLSRLNFEYAIFGKVHFCDTIIPFQTIPFIFGGPEYILSTKDNVMIKSLVHNMTVQEYREYLDISLEFFIKTNNWFPAANILLALNYDDQAYHLILEGSKELIHMQKFRTLRNLIILSNKSVALSYDNKAHLFQELNQMVQSLEDDDNIDSYDKRMYISSIRSSLLPTECGVQYYTIKTNIDQDNTVALNSIYGIIEIVASKIVNAPHKITISHNSPFVLDLALALAPQVISGAAAIFAAILPKIMDKHTNNKSDVESLAEAIKRYRPDFSESEVQNIVRSIARLEPELNNINIQVTPITLPPETSNNE